MSRQYSNRSFVPTNNSSSRRFHQQESPNDFSYFQYPPHRQINNNNHNHNFNRITASATNSASTPHYHFENPSAASFTRRPPWFDNDLNDHNRLSHHNNHTKHQRSSIPNQHNERKRPKPNENEREQQYRTHHYQPYPNHRPTQIQATNPTPRHVPSSSSSSSSSSFSRSFDNDTHNRHQSSPVVSPHRQLIPSSHTHHRNEITFEPPTHRSPLFHRTSMSTHIQPRPSPSFLLTNLLHRVVDAHAASYSNNHVHHHHHSPTASIDLIAFGWISPNHEIFSLPTAFSIQFGDFFDLIIPDETPVVGLTDSELERIPTMICKSHKSDDKCAVCLSEYQIGEKLKRLKCKHYFHSECIDPWLKTSTRCPICRGEQTK